LYRHLGSKDGIDGGAQGFGTIDHEQAPPLRADPVADQMFEQILGRFGVLGGALA